MTRRARIERLRAALAPREAETLRLYLSGLSQEAMGLEMDLCVTTVRVYLAKVRGKYAAHGLTLKRRLVRATKFSLPPRGGEGRAS